VRQRMLTVPEVERWLIKDGLLEPLE
jgi:hypothetical protein